MKKLLNLLFLFLASAATSASAQYVANRIHREQIGLRRLNISYDIERMKNAEFASQSKLALKIYSEVLPLDVKAKLIVEDLADRSKDKRFEVPLDIEPNNLASVSIPELTPHRIYRIWVTMVTPGQDDVYKPYGYVSMPYYLVTWSPDAMHEKRRLSVTNALQHYYLNKLGQLGNMDCWAFAQRYLYRFFPYWNSQTHYGSHIPALAQSDSVIGDYARIPNYHSLIILAYDATNRMVWTVEGNYNSSIEVIGRYDFYNWWVTHQR